MIQCADCGKPVCCSEIYRFCGKDYCEDCAVAIKNLEAGGRFYEKQKKEGTNNDLEHSNSRNRR